MHLAHQALPSTWVLYTSYRYHWSVGQTGVSLAIVGLMAAIVQGGLTRFIIPRIGEKKAATIGLAIGAATFAGYGFATEGWMIYTLLVVGSLGGITGLAVQALISRGVGANEQGGVQGSLTSLASIAGIIGPPIATGLFAHFIGGGAAMVLPGAAFFFSAILVVGAMLLALRSFRKDPSAPPPCPVSPPAQTSVS